MSDDQLEEKQKNKGGRPMSASSKKLMTKIRKLESELEKVKEVNLSKLDETIDLSMNAFCVIHDDEKREYNLVTVAFDLDTGLGKVKEVKRLADNYARMLFEMKKLLANNTFLQGE